MRKYMPFVAALIVASPVYAQRGGGPGPYRLTIDAEVVKGSPYSADVVNESVQMLSDGNRIVHRTTSRVYRDSEGRTRRETDRGNGTAEIIISDPLVGKSWTLDIESRTAIERPRPLVLAGNVNRGGELEALNVLINGQLASFVARGGNGTGSAVLTPNEQSVEEKLTAKTIEGVRVEGVRRTQTIPAGAIGNERPIVVTSDQWTSPELKALVLSESNDPRTGTSTYKLVNVKRSEPAASLFQVPGDFTIQTGPIGGRGVGARGRQ